MGQPASAALRERLVADGEAGHSCRAAARLVGVSAGCGPAGARHYRAQAAGPCARGGGHAWPAHRAFLPEVVRAEPDITRKERAGAGAHGVRVQPSSLHRALRRAGHSDERRAGRPGAREG